MNPTDQYTVDTIMYNGDIKPAPVVSTEGSSLNTDTNIALSQSMDSVNTTPEDEVSLYQLIFLISIHVVFIIRGMNLY